MIKQQKIHSIDQLFYIATTYRPHQFTDEELLESLILASKQNWPALIRLHYATGRLEENLYWPLYLAISHGSYESAETLLELRAEKQPSADNYFDHELLHKAIKYEQTHLVQLLLEHGASLSVTNHRGWTPLQHACLKRNFEVVSILIKHGADPLEMGKSQDSAIQLAIHSDSGEIITLLLKHGAQLPLPREDGRTILHTLVKYERVNAMKAILESGHPVDPFWEYKGTPLTFSLHYQTHKSEKQFQIAQLLIQHGADLHARIEEGEWTAMCMAVQTGDIKWIKLFVEAGGDMNIKGYRGLPAFSYAIKDSELEVLEYLIEKGANVHHQDDEGDTPLHYISHSSEFLAAALLLKSGADINALNKEHATPLHRIAQYGDSATIKFMLQNGADPTLKDKSNQTAIDYAKYNDDRDEIIKLLQESMNKLTTQPAPH